MGNNPGTVNLDAYFARIGYAGDRTNIAAVLAHHMHAIPFENIDVLLGRPPRLDLDSLETKLVTERRGGYCYEHSTLLAAVLTELGFTVATHSARVVLVAPRDKAPRTHMFLTVGDRMLDPGFGGLAPRIPIPRDGSPANNYRLVRDGHELALELGTQRLWISSFEHNLPVDFEMANHYTATHPRSHFTQRLTMRAFTLDGGQVRIQNRDLTFLAADGETTERRQITDRRELRAIVGEHFGFDLPALETLRVPSIPEWS